MDVIETHEQDADQYDRQAKAWGWNPDVFFGLMWEYVQPGDGLLDVGIGTGLCSRPFHKAGVRAFGMDGSAEMLHICRKHNPNFTLSRHDVNAHPWPYENNAFNHVIAGGVLHFFEDLEPFFQEVTRVLCDRGTFGFNTSLLTRDDLSRDGLPVDSPYAGVLDEASGVKIFKHSEVYILNLLDVLGMSLEKKLYFLASQNPETKAAHYSTLFIATSTSPGTS